MHLRPAGDRIQFRPLMHFRPVGIILFAIMAKPEYIAIGLVQLRAFMVCLVFPNHEVPFNILPEFIHHQRQHDLFPQSLMHQVQGLDPAGVQRQPTSFSTGIFLDSSKKYQPLGKGVKGNLLFIGVIISFRQ